MEDSLKKHQVGWPFAIRFICTLIFSLFLAFLLFPSFPRALSAPSGPSASAACPVQFLKFNASGVSVRVKNVSGKKIVGLVFNAAIADATEHWKWYHWDFDDSRPIRDFGWNKTINSGSAKTLSWYQADLDFQH